jgi:serine/threonine-protein phosphatase 5
LYGIAIQDAQKAIELDPSFIKAYYRRAVGNIGLSKLKGFDSWFFIL